MILLLVTSCSKKNNDSSSGSDSFSSGSDVTLKVTQNFGKEIIFENRTEYKKNMTVYDLLMDNVSVKAKEGGGFITEINGVKIRTKSSGEMYGWFYFVNGILADTGAISYEINPGDAVWWDNHEWLKSGFSNSSAIGLYPEPFLNGYRGKVLETKVLYAGEKSSQAEKVMSFLKESGVDRISVSSFSEELLKERTGPVIIIGEWEQLNKIDYISNLNDNYADSGIFLNINKGRINIMNQENKAVESFENDAGAVFSHGQGLGDSMPVWVVTGISEKGLEEAVKILTELSNEINNAYSAVIEAGEVKKLPVR